MNGKAITTRIGPREWLWSLWWGRLGAGQRMKVPAKGLYKRWRVSSHDEGSMSVVMTGLIGLLGVLAVALGLIAQSAGSAQIASTAADQAALAAAHDLLVGAAMGHPCSIAAQVAQKNHSQLQHCSELATSVQVVVRENRGALATARAGAPPGLGP